MPKIAPLALTPFWQTSDKRTCKLYLGEVRDVLKRMPEKSCQCIITSPPYFALRDYGTGEWSGGNPDCLHLPQSSSERVGHYTSAFSDRAVWNGADGGGGVLLSKSCPKCGATRIDQQIGSEQLHDCLGWATKKECGECHVCVMVNVFREVKRVLRDDGTIFLNYGDSYASGASRRDVPACDTSSKGLSDSSGIDFAYPDLCDVCSSVLLNHISGTSRPSSESLQQLVGKARGNKRLGSSLASPVVLPQFGQASTKPLSSLPLSELCSHCANCGACLAVLRSSSHDARLCVRRKHNLSVYDSSHVVSQETAAKKNSTSGTGQIAGASGRHKSGKVSGLVSYQGSTKPYNQLQAGNLVGIPWRIALALQADGWILRQDIIWAKPSPMPESVRNRCTKAHEYIFLLAKKAGYFYDSEAIKEKSVDPDGSAARYEAGGFGGEKNLALVEANKNGIGRRTSVVGEREFDGSRNKRSVWTISSGGYPGAHFATFPRALVEPCLLAGSSEYGACADCGAPWKRVLEEKNGWDKFRAEDTARRSGVNSCSNSVAGVETKTVGWIPTCECHGHFEKRKGTRLGYGSYHAHEQDGVAYGLRQDGRGTAAIPGEPTVELETTITEYIPDIPLEDHPVRPCIVADIFVGSGTVPLVAIEHGRWSWGIDLSREYLENHAKPRIQGALLARPAMAHLAGIAPPQAIQGGREI